MHTYQFRSCHRCPPARARGRPERPTPVPALAAGATQPTPAFAAASSASRCSIARPAPALSLAAIANSGTRGSLKPPAAVPSGVEGTARTNGRHSHDRQHSYNGNGNGHDASKDQYHANAHTNGNGNGRPHFNGTFGPASSASASPSASSAPSASSSTAAAPGCVRVHVVVPRCVTVPGERLVLVGDCGPLGRWDVAAGVQLAWSAGHMHTGSFSLPAGDYLWALNAKLVKVRGERGGRPDPDGLDWEPGSDRRIALEHSPKATATAGAPPVGASSRINKASGGAVTAEEASEQGGGGGGLGGLGGLGVTQCEYVVVAHWGHTEATSVLAREVLGEVTALQEQLSHALSELRAARAAAAGNQDKLARMAEALANAERAAKHSADELVGLQARHDAMAAELSEAKRQAKAATEEAAAATAAAAAAAKAGGAAAAEAEARASARYEGRLAELKRQLDGVKSAYASEVASLTERLEASARREAEAAEMVEALREIVQTDVGRLRSELAQLVDEYVSARQQLAAQAQQLEASEKLRMQQVDGLSGEIQNLIARYNGAQATIAEQQRQLAEQQASRGGPLPTRPKEPAQQPNVTVPPPPPDSHAGREWRADWARLRKLTSGGGTPAVAPAPA